MTKVYSRILAKRGRCGLYMTGAVKYLKKSERLAYMCVANGQGLLRRPRGRAPLHCGVDIAPGPAESFAALKTTAVQATLWRYAMDQWGNLIAREIEAPRGEEGRAPFDHAALGAGDRVICAGACYIANGKLRWIDNASERYRPGREQLVSAIAMLRCDGVDLSDCGAGLVAPGPRGRWAIHGYTIPGLLSGAEAPDLGVL